MIRRLRSLIALAAALIAAIAAAQPAAATAIERVVSPGGIEAWLVREPSLPLVALNFAFLGGANEDPAVKPGVGYMAAALLDEGAGELDAKAFQQRIEDNAVELRFSVTRDYLYGSIRMLRDRQDQSIDLLRLALNEPRFDADAIERVRAQIVAEPAARNHRSEQHRHADMVEDRLPGPSLRPAEQRHAGIRRHHHRRRSQVLCRTACSRATTSRSPRSATSTPPRSARRSTACSARCPRPAS